MSFGNAVMRQTDSQRDPYAERKSISLNRGLAVFSTVNKFHEKKKRQGKTIQLLFRV